MIFDKLTKEAQDYEQAIQVPAMETMQSEQLVNAYASLMDAQAAITGMLDRLEFVMQTRMERDNSTKYEHPVYDVEIVAPATKYDQSKLMGILELVSEEKAIEVGAYLPAHDETKKVPARWDLRRVSKLRGYGGVSDLVEASKTIGRGKLKITQKEKVKISSPK